MYKILTVAFRDVYVTFTNRSLLIIMLVTPLVLALIMGFAFGSGGGEISISVIDIAVVNLDQGAGDQEYGAQVATILQAQPATDSGDTAVCSLAADSQSAQPAMTLDQILRTTILTDAAAARAGVDDGTYSAAVIIPADFSAVLASRQNPAEMLTESLQGLLRRLLPAFASPETAAAPVPTQVTVEIYANGSRPVSGGVVRSITEAVANRVVTGSTAVRATLDVLLQTPRNAPILLQAPDEAFADFACAFSGDLETVQLVRVPIDDIQVQSPFVQILVFIGSGQAMFFSIFTANGSLQTIYADRRRWTLQRMLMTPTPRVYILAGKVLGTLLLVLIQVGLLLLALTVLASIVSASPMFIWGPNPLLVVLVLLGIGLAVSGLAVFVTGIARSAEQAQIFGTLASMTMGVLGGVFGFQVGGTLQNFSIIHWGVTAFTKLSGGDTSIGLNLLMLFGIRAGLFAVGSWLFSRRIEV